MAPHCLSLAIPWHVLESCYDLEKHSSISLHSSMNVGYVKNSKKKHSIDLKFSRDKKSLLVEVHDRQNTLFSTGDNFECIIDDVCEDLCNSKESPRKRDLSARNRALVSDKVLSKRKGVKRRVSGDSDVEDDDDDDVPEFGCPRIQTRVRSGTLQVRKFFWEKSDSEPEGKAVKRKPRSENKTKSVSRSKAVADEVKPKRRTPGRKPRTVVQKSLDDGVVKQTGNDLVGLSSNADVQPSHAQSEGDLAAEENTHLSSDKSVEEADEAIAASHTGRLTVEMKVESDGIPGDETDTPLFLTGNSALADLSAVTGGGPTKSNNAIEKSCNECNEQEKELSNEPINADCEKQSNSSTEVSSVEGKELYNENSLSNDSLQINAEDNNGKAIKLDDTIELSHGLSQEESTLKETTKKSKPFGKKSSNAPKTTKARATSPKRKRSRKKKEKEPKIIWKNRKLRTVKLDGGDCISDDDEEEENLHYPFEYAGVLIQKDATFFTKAELKAISQELSPERIIVAICPLCKLVLNQNVLCHMKKVHHTGPGNSFVSISNKELPSKLEGLVQQLLDKQVEVDIACPFCEDKFVSMAILKHLHTDHSTELDSDDLLSKQVLCRMIRTRRSAAAATEDKRIRRLRHIAGSHQVYCPFCEKLISRKAISHHINTFCSGNLMRGDHLHCKECMHVSVTEADFRKHHEKHHANRAYVCQYCAKTFLRKQQFFAHLRHKHLHGKNIPKEPIHCTAPGCTYKTFLPVRMKQHFVRMHDKGGKRFKCESCEETFFLRETLVKHLYHAHKEVRRHTCPGCKRLFLDLQAYQRHTTVCLDLNSPEGQIKFKKIAGKAARRVFTGEIDKEAHDEESFLQHLDKEEMKSLKKEAGRRTRKRGGVLTWVKDEEDEDVDVGDSEVVDGTEAGEVHVELEQVDVGVGLEQLIMESAEHGGEQLVYIMQDDSASNTNYIIHNQIASPETLLVTGQEAQPHVNQIVHDVVVEEQKPSELININDQQLKNIPPGTQLVVYTDSKSGEAKVQILK